MSLRPRFPAAVPIERGFRRLAHGDVHYRAAGSGPVVLALHESPRSSLSLVSVIEALSPRFRVIAPDTPGYGLSTPLTPPAPSMDDFIDALVALLDSFGVQRAAVYGTHTGAALALALASRQPERVSALVLDGLSAFDAREVEAFADRYLIPYEPAWDGAHVMRLWSRVKDLYTWFPWYAQSAERRLASEPDSLQPLQRSALGFLQAGEHYAKAYIRAAELQPGPLLASLKVPAQVMARPGDLIADHLERLTPSPAWTLRPLDRSPGDWRAALVEGVQAGPTPSLASPRPQPRLGAHLLPVGEGWLHAIVDGAAEGPLHLLLPGLPGDLAAFVSDQQAEHPTARLIALSPPGCGGSDPAADPAPGLDATLDILDAALRQLVGAAAPERIKAQGASAVLAQLWAGRRGWATPIELRDAPAWLDPDVELPTRSGLSPLPARWDGAHLTAAWFQLRDLALYDTPPGCGETLRRSAGDLQDVARLDRIFRSYVQGPQCADLLERVVAHLRLSRIGRS